jgi:hypothetical protein
MSYVIEGLAVEAFRPLFGQSDEALAAQGIVRVRAEAKPGFPCRITLEDAEPGETLLLLHHADHAVATPYRNAYAIYVREAAVATARTRDALPQVFEGRPIALRGYDEAGMLRGATLALAGDADARIRELFDRPEIAYIHAHNAAHGCFAARVDRA